MFDWLLLIYMEKFFNFFEMKTCLFFWAIFLISAGNSFQILGPW